MPLVSVVMSVKNGMPYLRETIDSVLAQSFSDFEFIVMDDGSSDETPDVVRSYSDPRVKLFQQENTGVSTAKNRAIAKSSGKYIAIIDADDLWMKDKLKHQVEFLEKHTDHVVVGGYADIIDQEGNYLYTEGKPVEDADIRAHQENRNPWTHSAVTFTRKAFDAVGGYYEPVKQYIMDYMLMYQLSLKGKVHQLPEVVVQYRIVPTALSSKANPKLFDEITHRAIRKGSMSDEDLRLMKEIKAREKRTPEFKRSMYHLYLGRSYLFHNFKRKQSIKHLKECLRLNPSLSVARIYLWMARLLPKAVIQRIYKSMSPIAGSTFVKNG